MCVKRSLNVRPLGIILLCIVFLGNQFDGWQKVAKRMAPWKKHQSKRVSDNVI